MKTYDEHLTEIVAQLRMLTGVYDTRLMAPAMLSMASALFERLIKGGLMTPEGVTDVFEYSLKGALTPLDAPPTFAVGPASDSIN